MGIAIDTIGYYRTSGTAADTDFGAATAASGDSFTIRSFSTTAEALLLNMLYGAATSGGAFRVRSPMLHDNVRGIQITPGELATQFLLPPEAQQMLRAQDTLAVEMLVAGASETDVGALIVYYSDLAGASARLHSWGDISGGIKAIKPLEVDVAEGSTPGDWIDQVITNTEDLLHANKDYAVLGYVLNDNAVAIGIKGIETGNLRICGPAVSRTLDVSNYFVEMSRWTGKPMIPVINSANKDSLYVSLLSNYTGGTVKVQLILAEMANNLSG